MVHGRWVRLVRAGGCYPLLVFSRDLIPRVLLRLTSLERTRSPHQVTVYGSSSQDGDLDKPLDEHRSSSQDGDPGPDLSSALDAFRAQEESTLGDEGYVVCDRTRCIPWIAEGRSRTALQ